MKRIASRLLLRSVLIAAAWLAAHLVGWRDYTSIISGTSPTGGTVTVLPLVLGVTYGVLYFGAMLVAPVLVIAAILLLVISRRTV